jgi:hypothetical protein
MPATKKTEKKPKAPAKRVEEERVSFIGDVLPRTTISAAARLSPTGVSIKGSGKYVRLSYDVQGTKYHQLIIANGDDCNGEEEIVFGYSDMHRLYQKGKTWYLSQDKDKYSWYTNDTIRNHYDNVKKCGAHLRKIINKARKNRKDPKLNPGNILDTDAWHVLPNCDYATVKIFIDALTEVAK